MKQLSLGLAKELTGPVIPVPEDIEEEVIAQLAEAITAVYGKAQEVRDEEPLGQ